MQVQAIITVSSSAHFYLQRGLPDRARRGPARCGGTDMEVDASDGGGGGEAQSSFLAAAEAALAALPPAAPRPRNADDAFFAEADAHREALARQAEAPVTQQQQPQEQQKEAGGSEAGGGVHECPEPGCGARFEDSAALQAHYRARHYFRCRVCSRTLPTPRLLELHIAEAHDAYFAAMAARGGMVYKCLVDGCDAVFASAAARGQHVRDAHGWPADAVHRFESGTARRKCAGGGKGSSKGKPTFQVGAGRGGRGGGEPAGKGVLGRGGRGRARGRGTRSLLPETSMHSADVAMEDA